MFFLLPFCFLATLLRLSACEEMYLIRFFLFFVVALFSPGAIIQCRRFIRKSSRSGNIYCLFDACSSIVVENRAAPNISEIPTRLTASSNPAAHSSVVDSRMPAEERMTQIPNRYLIELIRSESEGILVQTISRVRCRVTAVQRATLRWKCSRCGELAMKEECTGRCINPTECYFAAEARYVKA